jgi:hypothetical protein
MKMTTGTGTGTRTRTTTRMRTKMGIASLVALAAIAVGAFWVLVVSTGTALATSKGESMPPSSFYAVTLEGGAELADVPAPTEGMSPDRQDGPGDGAAALLTLSGFLGLIAGNLLRWSGGRG